MPECTKVKFVALASSIISTRTAHAILKIEKTKAVLTAKDNLGSQAGDMLAILGKDIGVDGVFARWDLLGEVDRLGDRDNALLNRTLEVDVLDLLAQVRLGVHQPDQTILDLKVDVCALVDGLVDGSDSLDNQLGASFWGIRAQVDALDADDIIVALLVTVFEGRLARDIEVVLNHALVIAKNAEAGCRCETEGQGNDGGEPHRCE